MSKMCLILVFYWAWFSSTSHMTLYNIDDRYSIKSQLEGCEIINLSMTCQEIPKIIPDKIRYVTVTNHNGTLEKAFRGSGWKRVETLHISGSTHEIANDQLNGLDSVSELSMSFPLMAKIAANVFIDTPRIQKLFLLNMNAVYTGKLFEALIQPNILNNLTELHFESSADMSPPQVEFTNKIADGFLQKPLTNLHVTKTIINVEAESTVKLLLILDILDISDSHISWKVECLPFPVDHNDDAPLLVYIVDISGAVFPFRKQNSIQKTISPLVQNLFFRTENVYINRYESSDCNLVLPNRTFNSKIFLKSLSVQQNNYRAIYGTLFTSANNSFEMLDVSQNKIGYISPDSLSTSVHLKTLILSHNKLYEMQMMPEFSELTAPLRNLSTLSMDSNTISYIPWNMFKYNEQLETLNLAGNQLTTVGFELSNLKLLKTLDITRNAIHFVESGNLKKLAAFVQVRRKHGQFQILMQENPFQCNCKSVRFIQWLFTVENNDKSQSYVCEYEGSSINIDTTSIKKSQFLCKRTLIIITSSIVSIALIGIVGGSLYGTRRRRRRHVANNRNNKFKQDFVDGLLPHEYVCFMAIASHDEDVVRNSMLTPLTAVLKEKLNTNKEVIATGYNFKPGFPIHEEAFNFVKRSCVFVAVVSDAFCESEYCTGEIREACTQQKPIIVVLLGTVAEDKMSAYLLEVFRRKARAKITRCENGDIRLVPDIETLAECVLTLAINGKEV